MGSISIEHTAPGSRMGAGRAPTNATGGRYSCPRRTRLLRTVMWSCAAVFFLASEGCLFVSPFKLAMAELTEVRVQDSSRFFELNKIAIIDIDGFISNGQGGLLSWVGTTVADVKQRLKKAEDDGSVVAVVVRVNSPGGEATAADIIYHEIRDLRERTDKPVVACIMNLGASGGYYVSLGADRIVAHPTAVTGSVGVIMQFLNIEGLYGKIGLKPVTVKSGDKKDIGSGSRAITPEAMRILQAINRQLFDRFLAAVRESRSDITADDLQLISDGRVFAAKQALDLKMIDGLGYLDDAIEVANRMANVRDAHVVLYRSFPHVNRNIYAMLHALEGKDVSLLREALHALIGPSGASHPAAVRHGAAFLYLWSPGL